MGRSLWGLLHFFDGVFPEYLGDFPSDDIRRIIRVMHSIGGVVILHQIVFPARQLPDVLKNTRNVVKTTTVLLSKFLEQSFVFYIDLMKVHENIGFGAGMAENFEVIVDGRPEWDVDFSNLGEEMALVCYWEIFFGQNGLKKIKIGDSFLF